MLRCLSAEIWAVMTQNWENWEITKSGWLDPLYQDMWLKVWYRVYLLRKKPLYQKGPKTHWNWAKFDKISQFSQFCVITAYISAERHLSKISYENFYSPWPPLTFKTIIIFHVKPLFTSAEGPTVKYQEYCSRYWNKP